MSEGLPLKQITIIRIITMTGGVLGALVMLFEYRFFHFGPDSLNYTTAPVALIGLLCFLNLVRHVRTLYRLGR